MPHEKRNQHFVPRSFLKGFATDLEDSLIWGYDKKYGTCTGKRSISQICSLDYYYEQVNPDGSKTQRLEDGFQAIETLAIRIIRNLSASKEFSSDDKGRLAFYIGLLLTRGPAFRDAIHEVHKHAAEITLQKEYESGRGPEPPKILQQHIVDGDITSAIKAKILPHVSLKYMCDAATYIGRSLCGKKWDIYYIENGESFVTSDTPVMFGDFSCDRKPTIGPAHPESLVLCPITKTMLLAARPYCKIDRTGSELVPVKEGMVAKVNESMCFNAQRFVYASAQSQEILSYIKKAKGYCKKFTTYRLGNTIISQWDTLINRHD